MKIRNALCLLASTTCIVGANAIARDENQIAEDAKRAAKSAVATFKKRGVSGLIVETKICYEQQIRKPNSPYCLYLDIASARVDQIFSKLRNVPRHEFFNVENFVLRAKPVLDRTSIPEESKSEYLSTVVDLMMAPTDAEVKKEM